MTIVSTGQLTLTDLNDTKQLILYLNPSTRTQVYDVNRLATDNGAYNPNFTSNNLVITPELFIAGGGGSNLLPSSNVVSVTWYEGSQTTTPIAEGSTTHYTIPTGSATTTTKTLSVKTNFQTKNSQLFTCVIVYTDPDTGFDITAKANVDIVKITNGQKGDVGTNAITAFITNSSVTLPANSSGTVSSFANSGTDIYVYDGATPLTYVAGTTHANGQFNVAVTTSNVTAGAISAGTNPARAIVANATALSQDIGSVTFTITGKSLTGATINSTVIQSFAKSRAGGDGTTPTSYWMTLSSFVIQKNVGGAFNPTAITATGFKQVGTGSPVSDASYKFRIDYDNGSGFVTGTPTSALASTTTATYNANLRAIRFRMYLSSVATPNDTNFIDEQTVLVVSDGATGIDAYFLNVWTPDGDTFKNHIGTLPIKADLYKGAGIITPTAHKWYEQDPTATTASGGDADGGNGWRLINSVATATTSPTLAQVANPNTKLVAGTYFVKYTWCGLSGETLGNTTQVSLAVTAGNDLRVTIPAFVTNARKARVYVGLTSGDANLRYQGDITTSAGNLVISHLDTQSETIPTVNTATGTAVTSGTLNVRGWAVDGMEGFKCVATSGLKYTGVAVLKDITDDIHVDIIGVSTFKNGQGSTQLTARLLQNGVEIPPTGYTFSWAVYNSDGSLSANISGDSHIVTVLASQVNGRGVLVCDVRKS